jgi:hypothetical protein
MAKSRQPSVVADFLAAAFAPALVMGMIYCLISFLILVFYRDGFQVRVNYLFALYIFASVLIARIAIDSGRAHALGYTIALGASTLFVISRFVVFQGPLASLSPLINAGLLALVGFLADRIVFDCTLIESDRDTSGEGLLQSLGLVRSDLAKASVGKAKRRRRHNPGVSILYFALLAIPLYGVGQIFLPSEATGVRERAFYLLFGYFACSFSLLVTTSFLGLRRYLSQRGVEIPFDFAATWLGMGLLGTLLFLGLCMLLPLPGREYGLFDLPFDIQSSEGMTASRYGWGGEGVGDGAGGAPTAPYPSPGSPSNVGSAGSDGTSDSEGAQGSSAGQGEGGGSSGGQSAQGGETADSNAKSPGGASRGANANSGGQGGEDQSGNAGSSESSMSESEDTSQGSGTTNQGNASRTNTSSPSAPSSNQNGTQGQSDTSGTTQEGSQSNSKAETTRRNSTPSSNNSNRPSKGMNHQGNDSNSTSQNSSGQDSGSPKSQPNSNPSEPQANTQNGASSTSNPSSERGTQNNPGQSTPDPSDASQGDRTQTSNPANSPKSKSSPQANRGRNQSTGQKGDSQNELSQDDQQPDSQDQSQPTESQSPNTQQPDTQQPDTQQPDTQQPDTQQPDTQQPDTQQPDTQPSESPPPTEPSEPWMNFELGSWMGPILKWFTIAALLGFFVYYAITHRAEFAAWLAGIKTWWNNLWGLEGEQPTEAGGELASQRRKQRATFASFSNPFRNRDAKKDSSELVRYTYAAMEAWGAERGVVRAEGQTAEEYLRRLSGALPKCQDELTNLANAYTRLAYAGRRAILVDMQSLQKLWIAMEQIAATPSINSAV